MRMWMCLLLWACRDPDPIDVHTGEPPRIDTGEPPFTTEPPKPIALDCVLQSASVGITPSDIPEGNELRYDCVVEVNPPQPVEIAVHKVDGTGPTRVFLSDRESGVHAITLYMMAPQTGYRATASAVRDPDLRDEISMTTGPLPPGAQATITTEGSTTAPLLGMASPCSDGAYVLILDPHTNEVLWYQNFTSTIFGYIDAASFTEDNTLLVISTGALIEANLAGEEVNRWFPGIDVPYGMHHDVLRKNGRTYALFWEEISIGESLYKMDGFYIFDEDGATIGEWHLIDHLIPTEPSDSLFGTDYSHANSIWVDDDDNVLISFRHLSAIAQINGDLTSPDFGEIQWRAAAPGSDFGSDYTIKTLVGGPADFERQHNAFWLPDGRLSLFDNRIDPVEGSRLLELSLDPTGATLLIEKSYDLPLHCDFQGGGWRTPAGNPLATCAPSRDGFEFDPITGEILWHGNVTCFEELGSYIPRFVPLDW